MPRSKALILAAIILLALSTRLLGLGSFMTADEENWMTRSTEFWHKFLKGDPGGTFITTHPGATAMWLIGAGEIVQEHRIGITVDSSTLSHFRLAATLPIAVATALLVGLATWLLMYTFPPRVALIAGFLLAVEPYLTGLSQVAHVDALLSLCMLNSLLAFFWYLRTRSYKALLLAGICFGLAMGTKFLPALYTGLFMGTLLTWQHIWTFRTSWRDYIAAGAFLFGISFLAFYAIWPALWVKVDLDTSLQKDVANITSDEHVVLEEDGEVISPVTFYAKTIASRVTPFVLILASVTVLLAAVRVAYHRQASYTWWMFLYAVGFVILITYIAKKADRYALPALVVLPLLTAAGMHIVLQIIQDRLRKPFVYGLSLAVLAFFLIAQVVAWSPYAIAYTNPFYNGQSLTQQGWGEGLDAAARWLNTHPLADRLTVASWYPSVLATYFKGKTMSLSSRQDDRVGFVVLYRNMYGRGGDNVAADILEEFRDKKPEHIVYIQGEPYVWIYNTLGLRYFLKNAGEITDSVEVGQTVTPEQDNWSSIELGMATFSGRLNTHDVILHIKENPQSTADLRTVTINARDIKDGDWQKFSFEPLADSAHKTFFVSLTSPSSIAGNAITVHYVDRDVLKGDMYLRGSLRKGWDVAYRIP